jgi:cytosine/adenosine deaminase-related metal-dependent hydrolase
VVTDHELWPEGTVLLAGDRIKDVSRQLLETDEVHEYSDGLVVPGFVDLLGERVLRGGRRH